MSKRQKAHGNTGRVYNPKGRVCIFPGKHVRVNSFITAHGKLEMEAKRQQLAALVGWLPWQVSDTDVVEYAMRGHDKTVAYLQLHPVKERRGQ